MRSSNLKLIAILAVVLASIDAFGASILAFSFVEPRGIQNEASLVSALERRAQAAGFAISDCKVFLEIQAGFVDMFKRALVDSPVQRDKALGLIVDQLVRTGCLPASASAESPIYIARILIEVDQGRGDRRSATVVFHQLVTGERKEGRYEEPKDVSASSHYSWQEIVERAARRALDGSNENPIPRMTVKKAARVGSSLRLSAAGSSDPDGDSLEFSWRCSVLVREESAHILKLLPSKSVLDVPEQGVLAPLGLYGEGGALERYVIPSPGDATREEFECPVPIARATEVVLTVKDNHGGERVLTETFQPQLKKRWRVGVTSMVNSSAVNSNAEGDELELQLEAGFSWAGFRIDNGMGFEVVVVIGYGVGGRYSRFVDDPSLQMGRHVVFAGLESVFNFTPMVAAYVRSVYGVVFVPGQRFFVSEGGAEGDGFFRPQVFSHVALLAGVELGSFHGLFASPIRGGTGFDDEKDVFSLLVEGGYFRFGAGLANTPRKEPYTKGEGFVLDFGVGVRF